MRGLVVFERLKAVSRPCAKGSKLGMGLGARLCNDTMIIT